MQVKRKYMRNDGWFRVTDKKYISKPIQLEKDNGVVSLSVWNKVSEPLTVNNTRNDVKILDDNYKWIQIALIEKHFWLTAMYDNNDNLIELYFDITRDNYFDDMNNPYFDDLFSDIVVTYDRDVFVIDEDELQMALDEHTITEDEYEMVKKTTNDLYNYLLKNKEKVIELCQNYLRELQDELAIQR